MDGLKDFLRDFWERDFWDAPLFSIPFEHALVGCLLLGVFWFFLPSILEKFIERGVFVRTCHFLLALWMIPFFVTAVFSVFGIIHFFFPDALSPWLPDWLFEDE